MLNLLKRDTIENIDNIIDTVSEYYGLSSEELISRTQTSKVAHPRMLAMYLVRKNTNLSLEDIGERFGGRDHTTVIYACKKIDDFIHTNDEISAIIDLLTKKMTSHKL